MLFCKCHYCFSASHSTNQDLQQHLCVRFTVLHTKVAQCYSYCISRKSWPVPETWKGKALFLLHGPKTLSYKTCSLSSYYLLILCLFLCLLDFHGASALIHISRMHKQIRADKKKRRAQHRFCAFLLRLQNCWPAAETTALLPAEKDLLIKGSKLWLHCMTKMPTKPTNFAGAYIWLSAWTSSHVTQLWPLPAQMQHDTV